MSKWKRLEPRAVAASNIEGAYAHVAREHAKAKGIVEPLDWVEKVHDVNNRAAALSGLTSGLVARSD